MIFGILATVTVLAALGMGFAELREQYIGNKRKLNGKMFGHFLGVFAITFLLFSLGSSIIMGVSRIIAIEQTANQQNIVSFSKYELAPNSSLDATDGLKFVAIEENGNLVTKTINSYNELTINSLEADTVEVTTVEHVYTLVAPFPLRTETTVVVK